MTNATNKKTTNKETISDIPNQEIEKKCFVIMPIADHPDYQTGHFNRVYEYLIKPACIKAGYIPLRADDSKASHMIMHDILKKIMDCDMAICDLSTKNANVFYELGLRQAFNKKTILITDGIEKAPFDIAGFRYVSYSPSLRVDTVNTEISLISDMLVETEKAPEDDVNSIVKLLELSPAKINPKELNNNESMIFNMIEKLSRQIEYLKYDTEKNSLNLINNKNSLKGNVYFSSSHESSTENDLTLENILSSSPKMASNYKYSFNDKSIGTLSTVNPSELKFIMDDKSSIVFPNTTDTRKTIKATSFINLY